MNAHALENDATMIRSKTFRTGRTSFVRCVLEKTTMRVAGAEVNLKVDRTATGARGSRLRPCVHVLLALLAMTAGCRTRVIDDPVDAPLTLATGGATLRDVDEAIWRAARKEGWVPEYLSPGVVRATWRKKHHAATVRITHDRRRFTIEYEDSENLLREGNRIHRNYNSLVQRLAERIQREPITTVPPLQD